MRGLKGLKDVGFRALGLEGLRVRVPGLELVGLAGRWMFEVQDSEFVGLFLFQDSGLKGSADLGQRLLRVAGIHGFRDRG